MKFSLSFKGVIIGAVLCLFGSLGVGYFQQDWGSAVFHFWFPICVMTVGVGGSLIFTSLILGFIGEILKRYARRSEKHKA
jgi:uncharacterized transporter YbjL